MTSLSWLSSQNRPIAKTALPPRPLERFLVLTEGDHTRARPARRGIYLPKDLGERGHSDTRAAWHIGNRMKAAVSLQGEEAGPGAFKMSEARMTP